MLRFIIVILINLMIFVFLKVVYQLIFFLFGGIGASAGSEVYIPYISIASLITQLFIIYIFYKRKMYILNKKEVSILFLIPISMFILGYYDIIPF